MHKNIEKKKQTNWWFVSTNKHSVRGEYEKKILFEAKNHETKSHMVLFQYVCIDLLVNWRFIALVNFE